MIESSVPEKLDVIIQYLDFFKTLALLFLIYMIIKIIYNILMMMIGNA